MACKKRGLLCRFASSKSFKMKQQTLKENLLYQRKLKGYTQDELSDKDNCWCSYDSAY